MSERGHTCRMDNFVSPTLLGKCLRHMGFAPDTKVHLYGRTYDVISDPILLSNAAFIDAVDCQTGEKLRLRIPARVLKEANQRLLQGTEQRSADDFLRLSRRGDLDQRGMKPRFCVADEEG